MHVFIVEVQSYGRDSKSVIRPDKSVTLSFLLLSSVISRRGAVMGNSPWVGCQAYTKVSRYEVYMIY